MAACSSSFLSAAVLLMSLDRTTSQSTVFAPQNAVWPLLPLLLPPLTRMPARGLLLLLPAMLALGLLLLPPFSSPEEECAPPSEVVSSEAEKNSSFDTKN